MLTLPHPHQAYLKAFWVIMSLIATASVLGIFWILENGWGVLGGLVFGCISLVYGILEVNMKVMWVAYKVWNKLAERVTLALQTVIVAIIFFIMFLFVGKVGSSLQMEKPKGTQSRWIRRGTIPSHAYESQSSLQRSTPRDSHWVRFFAAWAGETGKYWAWFLLPFLYLLSFFDAQPSEEAPSGIYSLF